MLYPLKWRRVVMRMLPSDGDVLATDVRPMRDDPLLIDLVTRARNGDKQALGRSGRTIRAADLVHLPQAPAERS